jgi:hypothetical protein
MIKLYDDVDEEVLAFFDGLDDLKNDELLALVDLVDLEDPNYIGFPQLVESIIAGR